MLSVWEDEASLAEFIESMPHAETMKTLASQLTDERRFVRWVIEGSDMPPHWDDALGHIKALS